MNKIWQKWGWVVTVGIGSVLLIGCSLFSNETAPSICSRTEPFVPLCAPGVGVPHALRAVKQGNQFFLERRYEKARQEYENAVKMQPDFPEAHYNLGLALQYLGEREQMRKHFMEAANLAPGHKKIWDSPALKRYGDVPDRQYKNTSAPIPGMGTGGIGGIGGGGTYGGQ